MKAATCPVIPSPCLPPRSSRWVTWSSGPAVPLRFRVFLAMPQGYPNAATAIGRYDDDKTGAGSRRPGGRAGPASGNRPGQLPLVVQSSSHDSSARLGAAVTRRRHSRRGRQDRCFHREAALCLKHGCRTARLSQPRARSTLGGARPDAALMGTEHSPRRAGGRTVLVPRGAPRCGFETLARQRSSGAASGCRACGAAPLSS